MIRTPAVERIQKLLAVAEHRQRLAAKRHENAKELVQTLMRQLAEAMVAERMAAAERRR